MTDPTTHKLPYLIVGLNHRSAPIEIRESLSLPTDRLPAMLGELSAIPHMKECMVLSTCNRVEVVAAANGSIPEIAPFLARQSRFDETALRKHLYFHAGDDAVRHVFRVASSLDSMIVGEPQILGQMKEAFTVARAYGSAQTHLERLLSRAFSVAKRVRSETMIGSSAVSVASVAAQLAQKIFGSLTGRTIFLVGAGKMVELALRHLRANGAGHIYVANRTFSRAQALAESFSGTAVPWQDLYDAISHADIVITSTGATDPVFRREHGERAMAARRNRPMFFIDIAVPRDVAPEMQRVDGIFVYDIDDLQQIVSANAVDRAQEARRAEQIVSQEVERFRSRIFEQDVVPTIVTLQETMEMLRQAEIERVRSRLGPLTPEQEQAIDALTKGIVNKVLHTPISALKSAAKAQQAESLLTYIETLFDLPKRSGKNAKGACGE